MSREFQDVFVSDAVFEQVEDGEKTLTKVSGTAKRLGQINKNKRFYPKDVFTRAIEKAQDDVKSGGLIGLIRHPDGTRGEGPKGNPQLTAIKWTDLKLVGDDVKVEGVVVETAAGKDLKALRDAGVRVGLSTNMRGKVRYVKASELDAEYEPRDEYIQVFDELEFNTIDAVNGPADQFGALATDALEEELNNMNLKELKQQHPELYDQLKADVARDAEEGGASNDLTDEIVKLRADNKRLQDQINKATRTKIVDQLLADANLPKVGKQGNLDLDAIFHTRLEEVAFRAEDDEAAEKAVQDLIDERKALLGDGGDPDSTVSDNDTNPGVKRREPETKQAPERKTVQSARRLAGL